MCLTSANWVQIELANQIEQINSLLEERALHRGVSSGGQQHCLGVCRGEVPWRGGGGGYWSRRAVVAPQASALEYARESGGIAQRMRRPSLWSLSRLHTGLGGRVTYDDDAARRAAFPMEPQSVRAIPPAAPCTQTSGSGACVVLDHGLGDASYTIHNV